jgi:hypothetical protein
VDPAEYTYNWSVTRDDSVYALGAAPSFDFTPDTRGRYLVSLQVTDAAGHTSIVNSLTVVADDETPRTEEIPSSRRVIARSRTRVPLRVHRSWQ